MDLVILAIEEAIPQEGASSTHQVRSAAAEREILGTVEDGSGSDWTSAVRESARKGKNKAKIRYAWEGQQRRAATVRSWRSVLRKLRSRLDRGRPWQRNSCGEQTAVPQQGGGDAGDDRHRGPLIGLELWKHANFLDSWCSIDYPWIFLCLSLMGIPRSRGRPLRSDAEKHGLALLSRILGFFYCTPQISTGNRH